MFARARAIWAKPSVRWPVNIASVILMIPLVAWLSFYAFSKDEPLLPEIELLMNLERPADDPGNAYFVLAGITAPPAADAARVGSLAVMLAFERRDPRGSDIAPPPQLPGGPLAPVPPFANPCSDGRAVCLREMRASAGATEAWLKANDTVWQRFLGIAALPRYADLDLDAAKDAERLNTLAAAARSIAVAVWSSGQRAEAVQLIERNLTLCRLVLGGTVALATKRAAARCVADAWELAAALLLDEPQLVQKEAQRKRAALSDALARLARPLLPEEPEFLPIVHTELRARLPALGDHPNVAALTNHPNRWIDAALRPFYLRNATFNRYFEAMKAQAAFDRLGHTELAALRRRAGTVDRWAGWRSRNPIGARVLEFAPVDDLVPPMLEVRALESQRRLLLLALHCVRSGSLPKDPAACASGAPRELHNPFDGSLPKWDEPQRRFLMPVPSQDFAPEWVPAVSARP